MKSLSAQAWAARSDGTEANVSAVITARNARRYDSLPWIDGVYDESCVKIYLPHTQTRNGFMTLVARTSSDPANYINDVRGQTPKRPLLVQG
jgi:hypothetical protein